MRHSHLPRSRSLVLFYSRHFISSSYLQSPPHTLSMTIVAENVSTASNAAGDHEKFGFRREEMYTSKLAGTVGAYDRHVFLCYKSHNDWASQLEKSDNDPLPKLLSAALKARKDDMTLKTNLTICEGGEGSDFSDGDILIFPELMNYRHIKESDVDSFVDDVLVNGKTWASGVPEALSGSYVFVCAHASRDKRCGVCGPILIQKLQEEIKSRGLEGQIFVRACSHIGGHKYAGNLIIYSPDREGKIMGHWYGYVTPEDVSEILDQHIGKGVIIERLWRGQMGAPLKKDEKADGQKLPSENQKKSEQFQESGSNAKENVSGCCQGANGFSCCRDENPDQKTDSKIKEQPSKGLLNWMGRWEQNDLYLAAAVVGAVTTVAVAYSLYRKSG